jgi:hypothetical protein
MYVERHGNYTISSTQDLHINHYYKGRDSYMLLSRFYNTNFICIFDMEYYPFDTQICNMTFTLQVSLTRQYLFNIISCVSADTRAHSWLARRHCSHSYTGECCSLTDIYSFRELKASFQCSLMIGSNTRGLWT